MLCSESLWAELYFVYFLSGVSLKWWWNLHWRKGILLFAVAGALGSFFSSFMEEAQRSLCCLFERQTHKWIFSLPHLADSYSPGQGWSETSTRSARFCSLCFIIFHLFFSRKIFSKNVGLSDISLCFVGNWRTARWNWRTFSITSDCLWGIWIWKKLFVNHSLGTT